MRDKSYRVGKLSDMKGNQIGGNKPGVSAFEALRVDLDGIFEDIKREGETVVSEDVIDISFHGRVYDPHADNFEQQSEHYTARVRAIRGEYSVQYIKSKRTNDIIDCDVLRTEKHRNQLLNQHVPAVARNPVNAPTP